MLQTPLHLLWYVAIATAVNVPVEYLRAAQHVTVYTAIYIFDITVPSKIILHNVYDIQFYMHIPMSLCMCVGI